MKQIVFNEYSQLFILKKGKCKSTYLVSSSISLLLLKGDGTVVALVHLYFKFSSKVEQIWKEHPHVPQILNTMKNLVESVISQKYIGLEG